MEKFSQSFPSAPLPRAGRPWALAGVVGSGNLEVLVERDPKGAGRMTCEVQSSIPGYKASWLAALKDFAQNYPAAGTKVTIHDQGADPIVVTLRLRQAYEQLLGRHP